MLNIIQLMDDEGLGHCRRMITFAKQISTKSSKALMLISHKRRDHTKIIAKENLNYIEYDTNRNIRVLHASIINNHPSKRISSWSIDTKKNCVEIMEYIKKQRIYLRLFDNIQSCRMLADENIYPTPLFSHNDLDWSSYKGKLFGGWKYVLIRDEVKALKGKYVKKNRRNCVISFGGNDPQNLTIKLMFILKHIADEIPITVIVGPRFNNTEQILNFNREVGRKFNVVTSQENIHHYIASAKLLITALGQTTLEAMFLGVSCVCVSNQVKDKLDLDRLKKFDEVYVFEGFEQIEHQTEKLEKIVKKNFY